MYYKRIDANGKPVEEAITEIIEVSVPVTATLTDFAFTIPAEAYGFVFKRLPVAAKVKINGKDPITVDESDKLSPILSLETLTITTTTTDATLPIIIQFIR